MKPVLTPPPRLAEPRQALLSYIQNLLNEVATRPAAAPPAAAPVPVPAPAAAPAPPSGPRVPDWGRQPFQALACEIAGMRLALPLDQLHGIIPWDGALTRLPGMSPERLGRVLVRGRQIEVIDLAWLILGRAGPAGPAGYLLILPGERWALACARIQEPALTPPDGVRWRRAGRPPFLAGVLTESLRPLLDLEEILARVEA